MTNTFISINIFKLENNNETVTIFKFCFVKDYMI